MTPAGVTGYNHSKNFSIAGFTINGGAGSNLNEASGGATTSCCVSIPTHWHKNLKATVTWSYDQRQDDSRPLPPPAEMTVDIPEYKDVGRVQVHFYDGPKIAIVVSPCDIQHPFYPMSAQDKLPWKDGFSKEEAINISKKTKDESMVTC